MLSVKNIKQDILELCSESEYGSWEFWPAKNKSEEVMGLIHRAIVELTHEQYIKALRKKPDKSFEEVSLDYERLRDELKQSMTPHNVDPESFYWFEATDLGKEADIAARTVN